MINAIEIRKIAELRLLEADALLQAGLFEGAIYLAGYSVELLLKARICDHLDIQEFFDKSYPRKDLAKPFKIHNLEDLMWLSGLRNKFEVAKQADLNLGIAWTWIVKEWSEEVRYFLKGSKTIIEAQNVLEAIVHPNYGFKKWILSQ